MEEAHHRSIIDHLDLGSNGHHMQEDLSKGVLRTIHNLENGTLHFITIPPPLSCSREQEYIESSLLGADLLSSHLPNNLLVDYISSPGSNNSATQFQTQSNGLLDHHTTGGAIQTYTAEDLQSLVEASNLQPAENDRKLFLQYVNKPATQLAHEAPVIVTNPKEINALAHLNDHDKPMSHSATNTQLVPGVGQLPLTTNGGNTSNFLQYHSDQLLNSSSQTNIAGGNGTGMLSSQNQHHHHHSSSHHHHHHHSVAATATQTQSSAGHQIVHNNAQTQQQQQQQHLQLQQQQQQLQQQAHQVEQHQSHLSSIYSLLHNECSPSKLFHVSSSVANTNITISGSTNQNCIQVSPLATPAQLKRVESPKRCSTTSSSNSYHVGGTQQQSISSSNSLVAPLDVTTTTMTNMTVTPTVSSNGGIESISVAEAAAAANFLSVATRDDDLLDCGTEAPSDDDEEYAALEAASTTVLECAVTHCSNVGSGVVGNGNNLSNNQHFSNQSNTTYLPHKKRLSKKLGEPHAAVTTLSSTALTKSTNQPQNAFQRDTVISNEHHLQPQTQQQEATDVANEEAKRTEIFSCQLCHASLDGQLAFFKHLKTHYEPERSTTSPTGTGPSIDADGGTGGSASGGGAGSEKESIDSKKKPKLPRVKHTKKLKLRDELDNAGVDLKTHPQAANTTNNTTTQGISSKTSMAAAGKSSNATHRQAQLSPEVTQPMSTSSTVPPVASGLTVTENSGEFSDAEDMLEGIRNVVQKVQEAVDTDTNDGLASSSSCVVIVGGSGNNNAGISTQRMQQPQVQLQEQKNSCSFETGVVTAANAVVGHHNGSGNSGTTDMVKSLEFGTDLVDPQEIHINAGGENFVLFLKSDFPDHDMLTDNVQSQPMSHGQLQQGHETTTSISTNQHHQQQQQMLAENTLQHAVTNTSHIQTATSSAFILDSTVSSQPLQSTASIADCDTIQILGLTSHEMTHHHHHHHPGDDDVDDIAKLSIDFNLAASSTIASHGVVMGTNSDVSKLAAHADVTVATTSLNVVSNDDLRFYVSDDEDIAERHSEANDGDANDGSLSHADAGEADEEEEEFESSMMYSLQEHDAQQSFVLKGPAEFVIEGKKKGRKPRPRIAIEVGGSVDDDVATTGGKRKGPLKKYPCAEPDCDKIFNSKTAVRYHELQHKNERPYTCDQCPKKFFTSSALKVHERLHSGEKPYKCEECGRAFRQWGDMKYHQSSIHSNEKSHQCEFCGKKFARRYSLVLHRKIHLNEKNHVCDVCRKAFRASSYLASHRMIHTGEKPYSCPVCEKRFRAGGDMKRHLKTHERKAADKEPVDRKGTKKPRIAAAAAAATAAAQAIHQSKQVSASVYEEDNSMRLTISKRKKGFIIANNSVATSTAAARKNVIDLTKIKNETAAGAGDRRHNIEPSATTRAMAAKDVIGSETSCNSASKTGSNAATSVDGDRSSDEPQLAYLTHQPDDATALIPDTVATRW